MWGGCNGAGAQPPQADRQRWSARPPARPQNPALAGQHIYQSREVQDKQIVRLVGKIPTLAALAYHRASGRKPAQPNQNLSYTEARAAWGAAQGPAAAGAARRAPAPHPPLPAAPPPLARRPQNFLYMLDAGSHPGYRPNPRLARALDILFILHAEHELNCRWGGRPLRACWGCAPCCRAA